MEEGYYLDDGTKVDEDSIPTPVLCTSCNKKQGKEVACNLTRIDQMDEIRKGEMFCCFAYETNDPNVDKESIFREMESYISRKR